ncbi:hypothetical protein MPTK1_5g04510 [Marchantia polymorpha subsp. ruderalis]|nr:hypothetical protein MARPO_0027s0175 [Marchantia polymorpha]BBN10558.1 hypothetical protein Mp_5g04510 [Marchantia polymorpha subsp. ruderalis]|eukprot:PTQ43077.1 hypothetical protein MARPO_0027s0175 [Marchantia polymorpha]
MNRERSQLLAFGHMLEVEMSNPREEAPRLDEFHKLISQRQLYEQNLKDARALMVEYERKVQECRRIEEEQGDLIRKIQIAEDIELEEKQNIFKELDTYKMLSMCHICNTEPRSALDLPCMHYICCEDCLDISKIWSGVQSCLMCRVRDHDTDQTDSEIQNSD